MYFLPGPCKTLLSARQPAEVPDQLELSYRDGVFFHQSLKLNSKNTIKEWICEVSLPNKFYIIVHFYVYTPTHKRLDSIRHLHADADTRGHVLPPFP